MSSLVTKHKKIKRDSKGNKKDAQLLELERDEFVFIRSRVPKTPDTPRKKKLKAELAKAKSQSRGVKRTLAAMEAESAHLKETVLEQKECLTHLKKELEAQKEKEKDCPAVIRAQRTASKT